MKKSNTYRRTSQGSLPAYAERSRANQQMHARWRNRLCDLCFQRGTIIIKGRLYCKDHAPKEGTQE